MKKIYVFLLIIIFVSPAFSQVPLPATLDFTSNASSAWADGVAQDGDGGSADISDLNINIFAADNVNFNVYPGSIIIWHDNNYYASGDAAFTGLTPGPDVTVTNNGVPAMVIKNSDNSQNFSLKSIELYDWGGSLWTIRSYDNGTLVGSINIMFDQINYDPKIVTQSDELVPAYFENIDEIRIIPNGAPVIWPSLNHISLDNPVTPTPVSLYSFTGRFQKGNAVLLEWNTASEQQNNYFIAERSMDGKHFDSIATIRGSGTSSNSHQYQYLDKTTGTNTLLFYRLKQVDFDHRFHVSKVITLKSANAHGKISIFPVPAREVIRLDMPPEEKLALKIYDTKGRVLYNRAYDHFDRNTQVNVANLLPGMYKLVVEKANGEIQIVSFIKQ